MAALLQGLKILWRQRAYLLLSMAGLSAATALALTMFARLSHELSFDRWIPHHERIYRIEATLHPPGSAPIRSARAPGVAFAHLVAELPGVEHASRAVSRQLVARVGDTRILMPALLVDAAFLNVFELQLQAGSDPAALSQPSNVVLSRSAARQAFGNGEALNRTLAVELGGRETTLRVAAISDDLPTNTQLEFSALVALRPEYFSAEPWVLNDWSANSALTYVRLDRTRTGADLDAALAAIVARHRRRGADGDGDSDLRLAARPIADVHLRSSGRGDLRPPGSEQQAWMLAAIIAGTLAMAALNHTNLAGALALRRAREIALRRILGASRASLAIQAVLESLVLALASAALALTLTLVAWPLIDRWTGGQLPTSPKFALELGAAALASGLLLGAVAGVVPAWRFATAGAGSLFAQVKGSGASRWLREGLCLLQFAVAFSLVIATALVHGQASHLARVDLGFDSRGLVSLNASNPGRPRPVPESLLQRLRQGPGVRGVARALVVPGVAFGWTIGALPTGESAASSLKTTLEVAFIDAAYFEVMGVPLLEGRALTSTQPLDDVTGADGAALARRGANVVIDAAAVRALGFSSPAQALGKTLRIEHWNDEVQIPVTVVGIAGSHQLRPSVAEAVPARVYVQDLGWANNVIVRRSAGGDDWMRQAWEAAIPAEPYRAEAASEAFARVADDYRRLGQLYAAGAVVALLIAGLGLHGLVAFTLQQRRKETALRRVLGAPRLSLFGLLAWPLLRPAVVAMLLSVPLSCGLMSRWLSGFASRIDISPAVVAAAVGLCLGLVAWVVAAQVAATLRRSPAESLREV